MSKWRFLLFAGLLSAPTIHALELGVDDLKVSGYVDVGRFQLRDTNATGEILSRMGAKWLINKELDENWSVVASPHWMFWRNQASDLRIPHIAGIKFDADLQGVVKYHSNANRAKVGLYEFKYNPDSKNLGEYLLRSGAYPTILESSQGKDILALSNIKVMGGEYGQDLGFFHYTGLVYFEQVAVPVNDMNAVLLASTGSEIGEVEIGACYSRFLKTGTPFKDGVSPELKEYIQSQGLKSKALKFSLRGRLNLASLFGMEEEDFKVYGEAALLGTKSDTLYYKKISERIPVMMGLDLPTFGLLNTLSIEGEYFNNPYGDKKYLSTDPRNSPLPIAAYAGSIKKFTDDDWKWSVYLHKAVNSWLDIKLRAASDHLRLLDWEGDFKQQPMTLRPRDWYFVARIEYHN